MSGRPWFKLYHGDWLSDSRLQVCSLAAQGLWIRLICVMEQRDDGGVIVGSVDSFSRLVGALPAEVEAALEELDMHRVAEIERDTSRRDHTVFTVMSRRVSREARDRVSARDRKRLQREREAESGRCHAGVTGEKSEVRNQRSEVREEPPHSPPAAGGAVAGGGEACDERNGPDGSTGTSTPLPLPVPTPRQPKETPCELDPTRSPNPSPDSSSNASAKSGKTRESSPVETHGKHRITTADIEAVFDAHDEGLRTLRQLQGRVHQPHARSGNKIAAKRRREVAEAIAAHGLPAVLLAARNLPLSDHHRGQNDRVTEYLEVTYAMRAVEREAARCRGDESAFRRDLEASIRAAARRSGGNGNGVIHSVKRTPEEIQRRRAIAEANVEARCRGEPTVRAMDVH